MKRRILLAWILVALFFAGGCNLLDALGEEDLSFTTGEDEYEAGDKVTLYLENNTDQAIGYNLCLASLQRKVGERWKRPGEADSDINNDGTKEICTLQEAQLKSGDEASYKQQLPVDLKEDTYRYQDSVALWGEGRESEETITTNTFAVE